MYMQVHAARLRGGGKDVVLKVLKPRVEDTLLTDLNFLYLAGKFLQIISPDLERTSLVGIIEDIRTSMLDEVRCSLASSLSVRSGPCTIAVSVCALQRTFQFIIIFAGFLP